jgi:hypothetical protein
VAVLKVVICSVEMETAEREFLGPLVCLGALEPVPDLLGVLITDKTVARRQVDIDSCFEETSFCVKNQIGTLGLVIGNML